MRREPVGRAVPARCAIAPLLAWLVTVSLAHAESRILVFSKTEGFRHDSIADGVALVHELGGEGGFSVEATEDASVFNDGDLARFRAVVWMNTTGDVLDGAQQAAFERFVGSGGGWVGIHSAADTEYEWPFYGELLAGAWFLSHPAIQMARLEITASGGSHPCCRHWAPQVFFEDEWYNFRDNPRDGGADVLVRLDESSYDAGGDAMGEDHPIVWRRFVGAGRAWYTGLGHRNETYADAGFRAHLAGGLGWAARLPPGDCDDDYEIEIDEVRRGVEIALRLAELPSCPAFDVSRDAAVSVEEIVEAVGGL
jgi:type 1 glutamine amidotransferase